MERCARADENGMSYKGGDYPIFIDVLIDQVISRGFITFHTST